MKASETKDLFQESEKLLRRRNPGSTTDRSLREEIVERRSSGFNNTCDLFEKAINFLQALFLGNHSNNGLSGVCVWGRDCLHTSHLFTMHTPHVSLIVTVVSFGVTAWMLRGYS